MPTDADTEAGRGEGRYEAIYGVMRECFSQDNYGRKCARKMTEKILRRLRGSDPGGHREPRDGPYCRGCGGPRQILRRV